MPFEVTPVFPLDGEGLVKDPKIVAAEIKAIYVRAEDLGGEVVAQDNLDVEGDSIYATAAQHVLYYVSKLPAFRQGSPVGQDRNG